MHLKTRRVHIAGIMPSPNATRTRQLCRNLTDCEDGFLKDASHVIIDRDKSLLQMRAFLEDNTDTKAIELPPKSPNLNAYVDRWFRSLKSECLDRMIFVCQKSLQNAVRGCVEHYHAERNHQGLGHELIGPSGASASSDGHVECREPLGGKLKYYH